MPLQTRGLCVAFAVFSINAMNKTFYCAQINIKLRQKHNTMNSICLAFSPWYLDRLWSMKTFSCNIGRNSACLKFYIKFSIPCFLSRRLHFDPVGLIYYQWFLLLLEISYNSWYIIPLFQRSRVSVVDVWVRERGRGGGWESWRPRKFGNRQFFGEFGPLRQPNCTRAVLNKYLQK